MTEGQVEVVLVQVEKGSSIGGFVGKVDMGGDFDVVKAAMHRW